MGGDEARTQEVSSGASAEKETPLEELLERTSRKASIVSSGFSEAETQLCVQLFALFSSPERLTAVFSQRDPSGFSASANASGVDFNAVKTLYSNIGAMDAPQVSEAVLSASRKLLDVHEHVERDSTSCEQKKTIVSSYLVVFANPSLLEPENHPSLERLAKCLVNLGPRERALAVLTLSSLKAADLEELVATVQQCITVQIYEASRVTETVQLCTKLLKILYDANIRSGQLPVSMFYNDAVNSKDLVRPEKQYFYWRNPQRYAFSFCNYPFILDLSTKSNILKLDSQLEMQDQLHQAFFHGLFQHGGFIEPFNVMRVRRDHLIHDAITHVQRKKDDLKKQLRVQFIGEDAVDEGGVRKEFFQLVMQELFDPKYGMFSYREQTRQFWFSLQGGELAQIQEEQDLKHSIEVQKSKEEERGQKHESKQEGVKKRHLPMDWSSDRDTAAEVREADNCSESARRSTTEGDPELKTTMQGSSDSAQVRRRQAMEDLELSREYELVGMLLGLAIYNQCILEIHFPSVLYKKLLGQPLGLSDLESLDSDLAKGLRSLLSFDGNVQEVFELTFQVTVEDIFGDRHVIDLKPGGSGVPLTNGNREEYVELATQFYLDKSICRQFMAFEKGFEHLVPEHVLKMFEPEELELLICGISELDFDDLEKGARYTDGYTAQHRIIREFWEISHALPDTEKRNLLMFVTGCHRAPIQGLSSLKFTISRNGPDTDRLPSSHTCFNHLLLPEYKTKEKFKNRLLTAINNAKGFGLQ